MNTVRWSQAEAEAEVEVEERTGAFEDYLLAVRSDGALERHYGGRDVEAGCDLPQLLEHISRDAPKALAWAS